MTLRGRHRAVARRSGIGAFAEKTLVAAGQCTKVDPSARAAAVGLLGCGVMAGLGAAINTGNVTRGKSRRRHRLRRRRRGRDRRLRAGRRVPDHRRRHRRPEARQAPKAWAPPTPSTHSTTDPVAAIQGSATGGVDGADVVIEAVGRPETWKQAFYARDLAGTVVLVGVPTPDMKVPDMPLIDVFGRGGALKSSWYGDCLPSRDFPMLVDLYQQGRLDLDAFVTEEIGLDDVEAAFERMHARRRPALGRDLLMAAAGRPRRRQRHVLPRRRDLRRRQQRLGGRRRRAECVVIDAPHDVDASSRWSADRKVKAIVCTHAHDDHVRVAPALRERRSARRSCCTPTTGRCGS